LELHSGHWESAKRYIRQRWDLALTGTPCVWTIANSVLEKTRLCDCFAAMNALDTKVCKGAGRSRAFMFTNYPARQRGLQRKLFSVRGQSSMFAKGAAKTTYREACSLSIYRFTECLRKINRGQKTQHGVVHSICAIGFFMSIPNTVFFGSLIRRPRCWRLVRGQHTSQDGEGGTPTFGKATSEAA
jgi:hypothetical protein